MMVHVYAAGTEQRRRIALAMNREPLEVRVHQIRQDVTTALYREPDAIGVLGFSSSLEAVRQIREMRIAGLDNLLLCLLREPTSNHSSRAVVLMAGADDAQPDRIDARELAARLLSLTQRLHRRPPVCGVGDAQFTPSTGILQSSSGRVRLTKAEGGLMMALAERPGRLLSVDNCARALGYQGGKDRNAVAVYICKLRKKLSGIGAVRIENEHGQGFRLVLEQSA